MRFLLLTLLVLAGAAGLALLARQDPGYVLFAYRGWTAETSLALVVVALLLAFTALYACVRLLVGSWRLPQRFGSWRRGRHALRARVATRRGLIALAEGNWPKAERYLTRFVHVSETPLINYLGAARAARSRGRTTAATATWPRRTARPPRRNWRWASPRPKCSCYRGKANTHWPP
jgi:HemY protein